MLLIVSVIEVEKTKGKKEQMGKGGVKRYMDMGRNMDMTRGKRVASCKKRPGLVRVKEGES